MFDSILFKKRMLSYSKSVTFFIDYYKKSIDTYLTSDYIVPFNFLLKENREHLKLYLIKNGNDLYNENWFNFLLNIPKKYRKDVKNILIYHYYLLNESIKSESEYSILNQIYSIPKDTKSQVYDIMEESINNGNRKNN